jgi:hypothetical protein
VAQSECGDFSCIHIYHLSASPDLFALGFQEIVPLTAQQIIQTDPEKMYADNGFNE